MRIVFDNLTYNERRALHQALEQHVENVACAELEPDEDACAEVWFDDEGAAHSHAERLLDQLDAMIARLAEKSA